MNNEEAYNFYTTNSQKSFSQISREYISKFNLDELEFEFFRREFANIKNERMIYSKEKDIATWKNFYFTSTLVNSAVSQNSNEDLSMEQLPASQSTVEFTENFCRKPLKQISEVRNKAIRNRLTTIMSHIEAVAQHENVSPKIISMYLVKLYSLDEYDISTANVTKELIQTGKFG